MRAATYIEILLCWVVWWYPFLFRAPHRQRRASITMVGPSRSGLLLETAGLLAALAFRVPFDAPLGTARAIAAMIPGPVAVVLGWTAVKHLGRQFRIQAGLY